MSRLPIRARVTLVFAAVMAVLLAGLGLFVYERFRSDLDDSINEGLRSRAEQVTRQAQALPGDGGLGVPLVQREESFAQVLTPDGRVLATGAELGTKPLLGPAERARAARGALIVEQSGAPVINSPARVFAKPVETPAGTVIVAAGTGLDDRKDNLASLRSVLLLGGPAALLLASLAGWFAVGIALRPVEEMRRRAAEISAHEPGERLPVAASEDELSRLGETLNGMLARLEAAFERERTFVDDASHELRTPLAMQKTELEMALRYSETPEELRAAIGSAVEEVDRLIRLAEDLLVLSRSQNGKLELDLAEVELGPLLEQARRRFEPRAAAAGRSLDVEVPAGARVNADRVRLEQALTNMLDNAMRHGEGEIMLSARPAAGGEGIELHVADQGPGFSADFAGVAFERFSRADPARGPGGSGLGLAIVEAVAHSHGGEARAENRPGGGADVSISIHGRFIGRA